MKKHRSALSILLILALALVPLAGCSGEQEAEPIEFFPSNGIDHNGYWEGVTALEHVELFDYQALTVPSERHVIPDETVQNEVDAILTGFTTGRQVSDRTVEDGDTVNIDYVGSVDGVEFEGGTTEGMGTEVTIGVTNYIDDFLQQLIGHSPGETVNVEVTFPEEYGVEELNGKDALFITEINYIVEPVTPELNNEFVAENFLENYGWSTVEELKQGISADMQKSAIQSYTQEYLMDNTAFLSLPDGLLTYMEQSMLNYYEEMAEYYGVELDEFISMSEGVASVDELIERERDNNVEQANYTLAIQAIAEDAGITAGDADVAAYFADNMGTEDYSPYEEQYGMPYLKQVALIHLVSDYLVDCAVLE